MRPRWSAQTPQTQKRLRCGETKRNRQQTPLTFPWCRCTYLVHSLYHYGTCISLSVDLSSYCTEVSQRTCVHVARRWCRTDLCPCCWAATVVGSELVMTLLRAETKAVVSLLNAGYWSTDRSLLTLTHIWFPTPFRMKLVKHSFLLGIVFPVCPRLSRRVPATKCSDSTLLFVDVVMSPSANSIQIECR